MDKRTRLLTMLLSLTLLVSLTLACSLPGAPSGGGAVPGGEETPTVQPPAGETPAAPPPTGETPAASPGQQFPFEMNEGALDNLNSYGYTFHFDGLSTMEGGVQKFELSTEGKRENSPSRAEQVAFHSSSDGDTQDVEFIYIEDLGKMWSKEGGGDWQELPVMDPSMLQIFDAFSLNFWWSAIFAGNPEGAQYVGDETINGVSAHHYKNTESGFLGSAVSGCTFASFQDDIWVAVDGSFPVKRQVGAQATCQGESGNFNLSMEVRDVNQPQNIQPPV
jgi:hypothetical protein